MKVAARTIHIHRAPVLALWGAVVAERLGYNRNTALTLGHALADLGESPLLNGATAVELLGQSIPTVETRSGLRALVVHMPCSPALAEQYLKNMFGDALEEVRAGMERLAQAHSPSDLMKDGLKLYEAFCPKVPSNGQDAGRGGEVFRLGRLLALARRAER